MWVILSLVLDFLLCVYAFYHPRFYVILFVALLYLLWYFDGSEYTGRRTWEQFRSLKIFRKFNPCSYYFSNETALCTIQRRLFILCPNASCMPLFWGFGLHGGKILKDLDVCYVVPKIMLKIPLLRDLLLWTGAICVDDERDIVNLLNKGRSVCYCPSMMRDSLHVQRQALNPNAPQTICFPSTELFDYCREERIQIIPVLVANEVHRYRFLGLGRVQRVFHKHLGYPFPLLFWTKCCGARPPLGLEIQIASPIDCHSRDSGEAIKKTFENAILSLNNNGRDRPIEFI